MSSFKASYDASYEVMYLRGVSLLKGQKEVATEGQFSFKTGFMLHEEVKAKTKGKWQSFKRVMKGVWNWIRFNLWGNKSPCYNLGIVLAHTIWILLFSFPPLFFVSWVIVSSTLLNPTYFSQAFNLKDIFNPNSTNRWWEITGTTTLMLVMLIVTLVIIGVSVFQLVSYYCTSLKISGAKRVRKTPCKACLDRSFLICIGILTFIYSLYFSLVLVWFILGAVLNPQEFLAYGTAAITFYAFIGSKMAEFNKLNTMIQTSMAEFVSVQLAKVTHAATHKESLAKSKKLSVMDA